LIGIWREEYTHASPLLNGRPHRAHAGLQHNFQEHWETVCWAFAPTEETQKAAQDYFDEILGNISVTEHTRVVTVHLRRGDYVGKAGIHGLLTVSERTLL